MVCEKPSFYLNMGVIYFWSKAELSYGGSMVTLGRRILK